MAQARTNRTKPSLSAVVKTRVSEAERATVCEAADLAGLPLAAFIRATILKRATGVSPALVRRHRIAARIAAWTSAIQSIAVDLAALRDRHADASDLLEAIAALRGEVAALHGAVLAAGEP